MVAKKLCSCKTLRQEHGALQGMTEQEVAGLQEDLSNFGREIEVMRVDVPAELLVELPEGVRAEDVERRLSQARLDLDNLKERRNRGFREAEQAVNDWRTKGPDIEAELAQGVG